MAKSDDFGLKGGIFAHSKKVYMRFSERAVHRFFGWELTMDATYMAGGVFSFEKGKGAYCIVNFASSIA